MPEPIKVLFIFPMAQVWGGEEAWLKFLERIDKNKIIPFCLVFGKGRLLKRLEEIGINYYCLPAARIRNMFSYLRNLFSMINFLNKNKFDVLNSLGIHLLTTLCAFFLNTPYILHIHTIHRLPLIDKWCLGRAKIIITVSNFSKEFLVSYGVKPEYIKVIYNGIDIKELEKKAKDTDIKEELHLDKYTQIVCYAGRIVKWKNLEMLIQAIPEVKVGYPGKVKFLFVGETPKIKEKEMDYNDTLLKLAQQLNVRDEVIFTGRRDDIASILKRIDIFAISSYLEACSMSILEAMAIGKPIVATRSGGNPELITKETGILVEPGDIDSFARAIIDLLEDEGKKVRMGNAAKNEIEAFFNIENNVNRLEEIMIHLAKSPCLKGELI